jgi:hypothetical protein
VTPIDHRNPRTNGDNDGQSLANITVFVDLFGYDLRSGRKGRRSAKTPICDLHFGCNLFRATLLVVGHRTVRRLGDVREMFLLVRITVALVISHGRQYRP